MRKFSFTEPETRSSETRDTGHSQNVAQVRSDEELIASAEARTSLSHAYPEMEMQRRLKAAIEDLIKESARARGSAFWIGVVLVALTVALVALTVVLAVRS